MSKRRKCFVPLKTGAENFYKKRLKLRNVKLH